MEKKIFLDFDGVLFEAILQVAWLNHTFNIESTHQDHMPTLAGHPSLRGILLKYLGEENCPDVRKE